MRVALVSSRAQAGDAIGNQIAEKLAFFLERGADVRVFVESKQRLHPAIAAHGHVLPEPRADGESWAFLASSDLVIFDYSQHYALLGLLPLLGGLKPRIVFDYHGVTPPALWGQHEREGLEKGARQRGLVWCADAAIVHSRFTQRELLEPTAYPSERLFRLGYPLDLDQWTPGLPDQALRAALNLPDATLLLYVGRIAPNKRVPMLIEALNRLRAMTPPVHAVVIGDNSDLYHDEMELCQRQAAELGVAERLHFLGRVNDTQLRDAYRSADIFVMPSLHEGFCLPVLEAMACGLPVIAARATALPETVADAGLTFTPDDADDLARQVRRVLDASSPARNASKSEASRIALVSFRYGTAFVGGAETSLRTIGTALHQAGHAVEVFTTCTIAESDWRNQLSEGTAEQDGITVHRFRLDPHDRARHLEAVRVLVESDGPITAQAELDYLKHSLHSAALVDALRQRQDEFDAIIVGPYLFGLTFDVARALPDKTLLLPCFHDEPFARLRAVHEVYERVGGILYHSPEEQVLAETVLGLNHAGATCIGTYLDTMAGEAGRGRNLVGSKRPYVLYCGRYSSQKDVPRLIAWSRRYASERPDRFTFAFMGQGETKIPPEPWACDLSFVTEAAKRDLLAGAAVLVQLSRQESLSLVALEAWAQGTPVLADAGCAVLHGHLERAEGGQAVHDYATFADTLDDLWTNPEWWRDRGKRGRDYVLDRFGSPTTFTSRLEEALRDLGRPLVERMRRQGFLRAMRFERSVWREQFSAVIEDVLDLPPRPYREQVEVLPRTTLKNVAVGTGRMLVPVRVVNQGTHAVVPEGPARLILNARVCDTADPGRVLSTEEVALPALLMPGQMLAAAVPVPVPAAEGNYQVVFYGARLGDEPPVTLESPAASSCLRLCVVQNSNDASVQCCAPMLDAVQAALTEAERLQRLPDDYLDVTEGWLASGKRWFKRKLLGNFKRAYVDVLSRRQTAFNQRVLSAVTELAECCATLDHAGNSARPHEQGEETVAEMRSALAALRLTVTTLEKRLARLEAGALLKEELHT